VSSHSSSLILLGNSINKDSSESHHNRRLTISIHLSITISIYNINRWKGDIAMPLVESLDSSLLLLVELLTEHWKKLSREHMSDNIEISRAVLYFCLYISRLERYIERGIDIHQYRRNRNSTSSG
jgi:hypothetical protein